MTLSCASRSILSFAISGFLRSNVKTSSPQSQLQACVWIQIPQARGRGGLSVCILGVEWGWWNSARETEIRASSTLLWTWPFKNFAPGFPGGVVVESLPANAGDAGSSPGLGGSHMPRSNSAHEPQLLSLRVWSLFSATREAAIVRGPRTTMNSGPRLPQLEKALAQKRRPNTAKNK